MKIFKMIFIIFLFYITQNTYSFPGDHNSLTCVKHFVTEGHSRYSNEQNLIIDLSSNDQNTVKTAREYVKANMEAIKAKIRKHHDFGTDITMWGDSLSDLVDAYGVVPFDHYGFIPPGDFGNEQGFIDSWSDYFTIFSDSYDDPFEAQNYATSEHQTEGLLGRVNTSLGYIEGIWDVLPDRNHCIEEQEVGKWSRTEYMKDPSSPRSLLMIGGNDMMQQAALFPFINKYQVERALENITFIIDWNIENGKQILLEGTIPAYAEGLYEPYNSIIVNRMSICSPIEDSLIEPDEVPWWICAYNPGICKMMLSAAITHNANVFKEFSNFNHKIFAGPYFSVKDGRHNPDPFKILMTTTSINQACINDRLLSTIGPSYESAYPNNVKLYALYNHFNKTGVDGYAQNFWVPKDGLFGKNPNYTEPPLDPIHIGPKGYQLWSSLIGNKLRALGWNKSTSVDEMPDPVVEIEGGGPGSKIRKKAKAVGLFGKDSSGIKAISSALAPSDGLKYGGFYKEYWDNNQIYIQQIKNASPEISIHDRYGEAYHLHGILLKKYLEIDGISELGFPMSDVLHSGAGGSLRRIYFECGYMTHNTFNLLEPDNYSIEGTDSCPSMQNNSDNYKPDFTNCLNKGECTGRWFEDYVFQLKPTVGNSPFEWIITENNYGFPGILDRAGRIRGGPTNNATGYWTITVKMKDALGKESEPKIVHISTGW